MNAKQYIEEMKEKYSSPKVWAMQQKCDYFHSCEENGIDTLDQLYLDRLHECDSWDYAEEIAKVYIIG